MKGCQTKRNIKPAANLQDEDTHVIRVTSIFYSAVQV